MFFTSIFYSRNISSLLFLISTFFSVQWQAAEEAVNVFYHYTYEGSEDIDSVTDPAMKASILAQINHFGQTPKQLFLKVHVKRRIDKKLHVYQKMTKLKCHLMMKINYK
jgi:hypothetical protein